MSALGRGYLVASAIGAALALFVQALISHVVKGDTTSVIFTKPTRVTVGGELTADIGPGTLAEVSQKGSIYWLNVRFSFADKTPPFEPTSRALPLRGEVRIEHP